MIKFRCEKCDSLEPCTCFCSGCGLDKDCCVCDFKEKDFKNERL